MSIFQSFILGAIQGLTEFIPVSSSAHLFLFPWVLGWAGESLTFDVALHLGTLTAVIVFYRREWIQITKDFFKYGFNGKTSEQRMPLYLVLATIPAAVVGVLIEKKAETVFRNPALIATTLAVMGILLWWADKKSPQKKDLSQIGLKEILIVGIAQCFALVPGVSRSGVTMFAGRLNSLNRPAAAKLSFLLSMPITLGACIFKLRHLTVTDLTQPSFLIGVGSSMVFGFLAIGGLIKFLQKKSFGVFAIYRMALALLIFFILATRKIPANPKRISR